MRNYWDDIKQKIAAASSDRLRSKFADKVGVQPNTVKAWVEGGTVPGIDKLGPIAAALGMSVTELVSPQERVLYQSAVPLRKTEAQILADTVRSVTNETALASIRACLVGFGIDVPRADEGTSPHHSEDA